MNSSKDLFSEFIKTGISIPELPENNKFTLESNEEKLIEIVEKTLLDNPRAVEDFNNGKKISVQFLIGYVMKLTSGRADPEITRKLIEKHLEK